MGKSDKAKKGKAEQEKAVRHFLTVSDYSGDEILKIVKLAAKLKKQRSKGELKPVLAGKNVALIFEKTSTRTRCAFEVACADTGANATFLDPSSSQIGHKESIADTARVLGRFYDAIEYRGFEQKTVVTLARYAGVPVINGLTATSHPTQMLADLLTMIEHSPKGKPLSEIEYAFFGDASNNMGLSLIELAAVMGMGVRVAAPAALQPDGAWLKRCKGIADLTGGRITVTEDPREAARGADFIHTDVWVSMGDDKSLWDERLRLLRPYRVDQKLIEASGNPNVKFMHCLPAYHDLNTAVGREVAEKHPSCDLSDGIEVSNEVFESERSVVFDQAENRMHTIKAILVYLLA